jgi:hypothetical protein
MGKQIAINKGYHYSAEVWENDAGEYYVVVTTDIYKRLYRKNYYPVANRMYYPVKWGKLKGVQLLLENLINADETLLKKTAERLDKLKRCEQTVNTTWNESDDATFLKK